MGTRCPPRPPPACVPAEVPPSRPPPRAAHHPLGRDSAEKDDKPLDADRRLRYGRADRCDRFVETSTMFEPARPPAERLDRRQERTHHQQGDDGNEEHEEEVDHRRLLFAPPRNGSSANNASASSIGRSRVRPAARRRIQSRTRTIGRPTVLPAISIKIQPAPTQSSA